MKKLGLSLCIPLIFSNSFASGIPVVDAGSIAQAVLNYQQLIMQYEQMLKDTMNFEKQMESMGVNMSEIGDILGKTQEMISQMRNLMSSIEKIPKDIYKESAKIMNACNFLESKGSNFRNRVNEARVLINTTNACISAVSDGTELGKDIQDLHKKAQEVMGSDYEEYRRLMHEAELMQRANTYLKENAKAGAANALIAVVDSMESEDSFYSRANFQKDLEAITKQISSNNNQKQAQSLTNSILVKILES